jgi:hypothetical protein
LGYYYVGLPVTFFKTIDFSRNGEMMNAGCAGSWKGLGMLLDLVASEAMGATNQTLTDADMEH